MLNILGEKKGVKQSATLPQPQIDTVTEKILDKTAITIEFKHPLTQAESMTINAKYGNNDIIKDFKIDKSADYASQYDTINSEFNKNLNELITQNKPNLIFDNLINGNYYILTNINDNAYVVIIRVESITEDSVTFKLYDKNKKILEEEIINKNKSYFDDFFIKQPNLYEINKYDIPTDVSTLPSSSVSQLSGLKDNQDQENHKGGYPPKKSRRIPKKSIKRNRRRNRKTNRAKI